MIVERGVFTWNNSIAVPPPSGRLTFRALNAEADPEFAAVLEACLAGTLDRVDRRRLETAPAREVARAYCRPDLGYFSYDLAWWRVAHDANGSAVGVLQPVIYNNSERDGLYEGTVHFIGVHNAHRGRGYIRDLLVEATAILQSVGVWRIYCDTDTDNVPMARCFLDLGYRAGGVRKVDRPL